MSTCIPIKENISIYEGDDCQIAFTSSLGDLTGYSVKLQARIETSSRYAIIDVDGVVTDAASGAYTVTFPSASTLGKAQEKAYFYDVKLTDSTGKVHTDRSGMMEIEPRTTDLLNTRTVSIYGVDVDKDGQSIRVASQDINFKGTGVQVSDNGKGVDVEIEKTATAPTLALHFAGIYDTLQDLKDALPRPTENMQAIVIQPSEKYYHAVASDWIELAPVGVFHSKYLGAYDTVDDLKIAEPSPQEDALAIVGTDAKSFYVFESGDWVQVGHTDLPTLAAGVADNKKRIEVAESHLQTLQSATGKNSNDISALYAPDKTTFDAKVEGHLANPKADISALQAKTQQLSAADGVLQSNIDQKISGIHVEDVDNHAFDDITSLTFEGATVQDDGSQTAHIVVSPKFTVADGQSPDSHSATGNAIVFNGGATVRTDPNDSDVMHVDLPGATGNTLSVGDGANASRDVDTILFNGHQAFGSGNTAEIHLEFAHFKTMAERDTWTAKFSTHMDFDLIALVDEDENGFVAYYRFDAATKSWKDYDAQGVVMSDSNGAIPKNIKTVVFGPGFAIQQAGDQEDAALVTYSGGSSDGDGMTINGKHISDLTVMAPLQIDNSQSQDRLLVDPRAYEAQHAASCLLQLDSDLTIVEGRATKLYTSHEIIPTGEYYSLNQVAGGVDVQDNTGGDTALTGGELTRIMGSVASYGTATDAGNVKLWFEYKDPSSILPASILEDVNGHPMVVERYYNQGDDLSAPLVVAGAMMATGNAPIVMKVEISAGSYIANPDQTLICIEQFNDGYETSLASIEFQRRLGIELHAEIKHFTQTMSSLKKEVEGISKTLAVVPPNTGYDFINEFGVQNLTAVQASIENDSLNIQDNSNIADFYVDSYIDNVKTRMLRGKQIDYSVTMKNPQDAFDLEVYAWTGKADRAGKIYNSRAEGIPTINDGFTLVKSKFIAEQPDGSARGYTDTATIPDNANNIFIIVRPHVNQSPISLALQGFMWGVPQEFTGYAETSRVNLHEQHLWFSENWAAFGLNSQGFASLRYTINNTPPAGNPMPVGKLLKGKAPVEIDNTVNQVGGSSDPENDGAIKFLKDGQASISKSYNVWNEQGTDNTVTFWDVIIGVDGQEDKIADSERTFTVPASTGAPGVVYTIPAYVTQVETGQRIAGRATSSKKDGAYLQSQNVSEYIVMTDIDFKEEVPVSFDSPDLVNAPIPKAMAQDRRVYSFTGNTQQNIQIPLTIPADVQLAEIEVTKVSGTTTTSIRDCEYAYDSATSTLTVHVGNGVADGKVYLTFWSGIA